MEKDLLLWQDLSQYCALLKSQKSDPYLNYIKVVDNLKAKMLVIETLHSWIYHTPNESIRLSLSKQLLREKFAEITDAFYRMGVKNRSMRTTPIRGSLSFTYDVLSNGRREPTVEESDVFLTETDQDLMSELMNLYEEWNIREIYQVEISEARITIFRDGSRRFDSRVSRMNKNFRVCLIKNKGLEVAPIPAVIPKPVEVVIPEVMNEGFIEVKKTYRKKEREPKVLSQAQLKEQEVVAERAEKRRRLEQRRNDKAKYVHWINSKKEGEEPENIFDISAERRAEIEYEAQRAAE